MYATHVLNSIENKGPKLEDHLMLQDLKYVFLDEVLGLPSKRDIDFTIDLVPRVVLVFKDDCPIFIGLEDAITRIDE